VLRPGLSARWCPGVPGSDRYLDTLVEVKRLVIRVHNTLSGAKEELKSRKPGQLDIYICGITPYSDTHLGHARPSVFWDTVVRFLRYRGWRVRVVQNVTDVNEKVLARAELEGISERALAERYYAQYEALMDALGVSCPDAAPWVSDHIGDIIDAISDLVEHGHAYEVDGDVYFDVTTYADYGRLSGQAPEDLRAGARLEVNEAKRHPADFALWKRITDDAPAWDSPWGRGRPGWHIECSALTREYLGFDFDIHAGGSDLIFPHHENERAQSESLSTCSGPQARYWVHHGMVTGEEGKMSKSLGNFVTVEEILEEYTPQVLRLFLLSAHYGKPLTYSEDRMDEAQKAWDRLRESVINLDDMLHRIDPVDQDSDGGVTAAIEQAVTGLQEGFRSAMEDDFNTARALAAVFEAVRQLNSQLFSGDFSPAGETVLALADMRDQLEIHARILGIWPDLLEAEGQATEHAREGDLLQVLLDVRERAREEKVFELADMIRDRLEDLGYTIEDTIEGPRVRHRGS